MSQSGALSSTGGSGGLVIETITGNSGGPVGPDATFNINLLGNNTLGIDIIGNPGTNTLTIIGIVSSTTQIGVIQIATNAETITGTDTSKAVTPDDLSAKLGVQTQFGVAIGNTTSGALNWSSAGTDGQVLIAATAADPAFSSLSSSDSSITFTPGPNTLSLQVSGGTTVGKTITGDSGGALSPTAGNWNLLGSGSITTSGAASTLTTQLTGLTNHAVLIGAGTSTITKVGPVASTGNVLMSNGAASDPGFSTATYPVSTTINQILYSSAANTVTGLATANNSIVLTDGSGVPSLATSLSNNFTFTTATSGATRTLTVSNTSNTASSNALQQVTVAGTSGGDPFTTYTVSGTTNWSQGVDNSDSDAYVLAASTALGTTNVMRATTAGEITYPLTPAFLAYLDSLTANVTGNGTTYTIGSAGALTEVFDQNSDFNTNGTFTAPVTGRYIFNASIGVVGTTIATSFTANLVTSNLTYQDFLQRAASGSNNTHLLGVLCDMDASDTATITMTVNGEAGDTADISGSGSTPRTFFSGYLAC